MFTLCQQSDIKTSLAHFKQPDILSDKYQTVNSLTIIDNLENKGMQYMGCSHGNPYKIANKGFQKHIIMFNTGYKIDDDNTITLLVTNSYNGKTSVQFNLGVFRFVCANGLISGNSLFKERVLHKGDTVEDQLENIYYKLTGVIPVLKNQAQNMMDKTIDYNQAIDYTKDVLEFVYNDQLDKYEIGNLSIDKATSCKRMEDSNLTMYNIFNRVQENVCKHGVHLKYTQETWENNKSNRMYRKMRPIKNIDRYKDVNQFMWDKALEYSA